MKKSFPKVILLDDDEKWLRLLSRLFSEFFGATIWATQDVEEAYKVAQYSPPDLLITDIMHDGLNGIGFSKRLRDSKVTKDINIWLISGNVEGILKKDLIKSGADLICCKPCSFDYLIENAKKIFDSNSASAESILLNLGVESPAIDYKRGIDFSSKDGCAAFAKDVIGFANYGGGDIVVGVDEPEKGRFVKVGVADADIGRYEVTCINKSISGYLDPPHHISSRVIQEGRKSFVLIKIPGVKKTPILAKKDNPSAKLYLGRIYTRTSCAETKEITHPDEIRALLERLSCNYK